MRVIRSASLEDAKRVIAAGEDAAREMQQPMNIAVVDAGGNLIAHERMDGAWLGSIDISINKAFTARAFDLPTEALAQHAQPNNQFYGIHASNHGRIMIFAGGMPLVRDGGLFVGVRPGAEPPTERGITVRAVAVQPDGERLAGLLADAASGRLPARVHAILPLERAADAHRELFRGGVRGKYVLRP